MESPWVTAARAAFDIVSGGKALFDNAVLESQTSPDELRRLLFYFSSIRRDAVPAAAKVCHLRQRVFVSQIREGTARRLEIAQSDR